MVRRGRRGVRSVKSKRQHTKSVEESLREIYNDPSNAGALGGVDRLLDEARRQKLDVSRRRVSDFLADEEAYARHRPVRKKFVRNHTFVHGIDHQWQADLAEVQQLKAQNDGVRYLLTCIDVFSKYAWVVPLQSKSESDMVRGLEKLFGSSNGRVPRRLQTDKGKEFTCKAVQRLLKARKIHFFTSESDNKAAVVERFNRTLKMRLYRYLTAAKTTRYIDVLQELVDGYNKARHRSIGMAPADVRKQHERTIWGRLYGSSDVSTVRSKSKQNVLVAGEAVRISRWKGPFEKGYAPNWSKELLNVHRVVNHPIPMYELRDAQDEPIKGRFYGNELQRVRRGEYVVEKILAERRRPDGTREVFVKWEGWPASYNSWIDKSSLHDMVVD
jgi:transposase InsO family protein